jgi:hypothetical protein
MIVLATLVGRGRLSGRLVRSSERLMSYCAVFFIRYSALRACACRPSP